MADEAFALSPIAARAALPSEADYDAIREAFMETSRGRWFLAEYARRNVTANCIAPGFIATPMTDALNAKQRETILSKVPAGRLGTPEEIAAAAVFLSSNEAAYVTGQTIHVNGGMAMF